MADIWQVWPNARRTRQDNARGDLSLPSIAEDHGGSVGRTAIRGGIRRPLIAGRKTTEDGGAYVDG